MSQSCRKEARDAAGGAQSLGDVGTAVVAAVPKKRGPPKGIRYGGRQKGSKNKRNAKVQELLLSLGCDPITGMARIAMNKKNPPELRGQMFKELAQYLHPKVRAVEISGPDGGPIENRDVTPEKVRENLRKVFGDVAGDASGGLTLVR